MTTPIKPQTPTPTSHTHTPHMHFHETQVDTFIHGQTWVCTVKENPIFPFPRVEELSKLQSSGSGEEITIFCNQSQSLLFSSC